MNFGRHAREDNFEINVVPLIDLMFMLVLFFVVSTTFEKKTEININLPESSPSQTDQRLEGIDVSVDARGHVYVGGQMLINTQLYTIREALVDLKRGRDDVPLVITADAAASHQSVVRVMDAARQAGLVKVTFVTHQVEEKSE
jgi:biopolymer transport protein ExbD